MHTTGILMLDQTTISSILTSRKAEYVITCPGLAFNKVTWVCELSLVTFYIFKLKLKVLFSSCLAIIHDIFLFNFYQSMSIKSYHIGISISIFLNDNEFNYNLVFTGQWYLLFSELATYYAFAHFLNGCLPSCQLVRNLWMLKVFMLCSLSAIKYQNITFSSWLYLWAFLYT